jgi:hypothetical protein
MVNRVTGHAAGDATDTTMAGTASLAENDVFVFRVADLADGGVALFVDAANFAGGQTNLRKAFIARHQGRRTARRTDHLTAATGGELKIVDGAADRNRLQGKRVTNLRGGRRAAGNSLANRDADRGDDVSLLAIGVLQEGQAGGTHRIVFDRGDRRFHAMLAALEIDDADLLLVTAADATGGDPAIHIAATGLLADFHKRLLGLGLRNIAEVRDSDVSRRRR